jgi:SAM-dependent methyltransferase
MPAGDPRLPAIHRGEPSPSAPLDNLQGAVRYWDEHPDLMAFLARDSPIHHDKMVERAMYLRLWGPHLQNARRVLDLGGGIGRFTTWLLDQGCTVELVDPDLRSLWRAINFSAGRPGLLDVHWSTGERLPQLAPVDTAVLCEVLNYVEDPARVLSRIWSALEPGGRLLVSVESRWGWAMASDVPLGTIEGWFSGIVHVPGDVWVRTYTEPQLRGLLEARFEVEAIIPSHYAFSGPFELASDVSRLTIEQALVLEDRLREHPVSAPLNRAWMAVARKPS